MRKGRPSLNSQELGMDLLQHPYLMATRGSIGASDGSTGAAGGAASTGGSERGGSGL